MSDGQEPILKELKSTISTEDEEALESPKETNQPNSHCYPTGRYQQARGDLYLLTMI